MRKNPIAKSFAVVAFATILFNSAFCQTDTALLSTMSLKDLLNIKVTTASKTLEELRVAPATVTVITKEQIKIRGYQSLLDLLYDLPDYKVDDKIYPGSRNSITVRGIQGQQNFLILLDGIRISSPTNEAMPIMENYPVNLASQIEVVYGPASALYGADAVAGVINIISKSPANNKDITIDASAAGGMYGYTNNTLFISKKLADKVNFMVSGQYYHDNQPDYTKVYKDDPLLSTAPYTSGTFSTVYGPIKPNTAYNKDYEAPTEAYNIYAAIHLDDFTASFFTSYSKLPSSYSANTSNAIYNKDVFIAQSISTGTASYRKTFDKITTTSTFTATGYLLSPKSNYRNVYSWLEPVYKYASSSMIKAEQQFDYKASKKLTLKAGGVYESYSSIPQSADLAEPVNKNDYIHGSYAGTETYYRPRGVSALFYHIKYNNSSAYLQGQYTPADKLHFTIGARYEYNSRYGHSFNPRLGLVYKAGKQTTVKFFYGSAFLAPATSTAYVQYGSFDTPDSGRTYHSNFLHLPNPGLKPIKSQNIEISFNQYITNNFSVTVNGYYTLLKGLYSFGNDNETSKLYNNIFNRIPVDYIEVFINNDRQRNYGGNIQLNWKKYYGRTSFNTYASLSYVNGTIDAGLVESLETTKDQQIAFISPIIFRLGVDFKAGKFSCSPRLIAPGRQNISGISDTTTAVTKRQTIAGYSLLNISIRYDITKKLSAFSNISNALNQRYKAVGFNMDLNNKDSDIFNSGQPQDPIRVMGGLNYTF